jgi:CheY-like chemotaxis protein
MYLPRAEHRTERSTKDARDIAATAIAGGGRTILVVEDDAGVRAVTSAFLKELQFNVLVAENAAAAWPVLQANVASIDLLFTDVVMPGGANGIELAAQARQLRKDLRVLLTSGYSESFNSSSVVGELLPKPYREADLLAKLQQLFAAGQVVGE